jgi:SAM-dependent methyltransferase
MEIRSRLTSPWHDIPLADYEGHMASPAVGQAPLLAAILEDLLKKHRPRSVAILGCSGGNGFERIPADVTRVVGVDINSDYIERLRDRFGDRIPGLELLACDVQGGDFGFEPVQLAYAALLLEYVAIDIALKRIHSVLTDGGILGTVLQLPHPISPSITPSAFPSLQKLAPFMRLVPPEELRTLAKRRGFEEIESRKETALGKTFQVQVFRRTAAAVSQ